MSQARARKAVEVMTTAGKPRNADATRAKILEAAISEFAARGLEARIEDIADIANANRRMAYYYFGSKEGLYLAALEEAYLQLAQAEESVDVDALSPTEAVAALISAKFDHFIAYPQYIEFVKIENVYRARHMKESQRIAELCDPLITNLERALKRGQATGEFRHDVTAFELSMMIASLAFFPVSNQHTVFAIFGTDLTEPATVERRRKMTIDMVLLYLAQKQARQSD
ncbi:TetR family transcriptional regulator [Roseiarcaceae bacterium H3SJ34-1]|uniref:TetR family transcriptional regulator n=1 Tax=Terripilifer ovatus TaxID=3032367 RepID=UPI003AB96D34|nr:TetR family transcriptional regulator [Roseiarcaceae bacterium H3SJ34-1]